MQLLFTSPSLTKPTVETFQEYAQKKFSKLSRFLPNFREDYFVRVSVQRERHMFVITLQFSVPERLIIKTRSSDLRKAIDQAYAIAKNSLTRRPKEHKY